MLLVVMFLATAIAALATLASARVVTETRHQKTIEDEARAVNLAFANLQHALNVVNNSAYDVDNHNLALQFALRGDFGGTASGVKDATAYAWLKDPTGVVHGFIEGTEVRVYQGRDYVKRLQKIKGETVATSIDPTNVSRNFFVLEAAGRSGDTLRIVSALVRENEPFSSFVFFQNQHTLGVSGAPKGLIHGNEKIAFYFPDGFYEDSVTAVKGFDYVSGATSANTTVMDGNPQAPPINLDVIDFDLMKTKSSYVGDAGLDAEILLKSTGEVQVKLYTKPRYDWVFGTQTIQVVTGYKEVATIVPETVQVGTRQESRTRTVITGYTTETYQEVIPVYTTQQVTQTRQVPVYEMQDVVKTRQVPVYELQTVTKYRTVRVFVPYDTGGDAGGGTAVGGGGSGQAGEYINVQEPYQVEENVLTGYNAETYTVRENVLVGYTTETYTVNQQVQTGTETVTRTRQVPVYATENYFETVPVYETRDTTVLVQEPIYGTETQQTATWTYFPPQFVRTDKLNVKGSNATVFIDGRVTKLSGSLNGHLTIVGNEKVRVTGNINYVDDKGRTAMANGGDYTKPYLRNPDYTGSSVLGVIARKDLVLTNSLPTKAEINATLMSVEGRVGIDGFAIAADGTPVKNYQAYMTDEEKLLENAYDKAGYSSKTYAKDSLRRIGGIVSNNRILETYIKPRSDGTSYVDSGFKRGSMKFDINLLFNPPPNFVEVPRPVLTYYAPVFFVRNNDG
jgi:hypothetical protein